MLAQIYLKRGALVPIHAHDSEQMTYILQGSLRFLIDGEEIIVREGKCCTSRRGCHTRPRRSRTRFELDVFSPVRTEWLDAADAGNL